MQNILTGVKDACRHKFNMFIILLNLYNTVAIMDKILHVSGGSGNLGCTRCRYKIFLVKLGEADTICPDYFRIDLLNIYN